MILLALAAASLVPNGKGPVEVYAFPDIDSCGYWVTQRRDGRGGNQGYEGWVLGFISGLNWFGNGDGNVAPGVKADGLLGWIDQYCSAHPLDSITTAGFKLAQELKRRSAS